MHEIIMKPIREVQRRLNVQARIRRILLGLVVCSCGMLAIAAIALQLESRILLLSAPVAIAGIAIFLLPQRNQKDGMVAAANAIDRHFDWKDSTVSAFDFVQKKSPSHMETLHINAAAETLQGVKANDVVKDGLSANEWRNLVATVLCFTLWGLAVALWHPTTLQQPVITFESLPTPNHLNRPDRASEFRSAESFAPEHWRHQSSNAVGRQYLKAQYARDVESVIEP
ncbi:MAG: hypothetical protein ACI9HK_005161 [Pirellulaceae bacterium]|jgi:hypothetical protein